MLQIFSHEKHGDKKMTLEVSRLNNEESFNTVLDILDSNFQTTGKDFLNSRKPLYLNHLIANAANLLHSLKKTLTRFTQQLF